MENIQVVLRVRPQNNTEIETKDEEIWSVLPPNKICLTNEKYVELIKSRKLGSGHRTEYTFNSCFNQFQSTMKLYETIIKRIILSSLDGINGTIFMYGQTGSGKTFTMMGPQSSVYAQMIANANQDTTKTTEKTNTAMKILRNDNQYGQSQQKNTLIAPNIYLSSRSKSPLSFQREKTPSKISEKSPRRQLFKEINTANGSSPEKMDITKIGVDTESNLAEPNKVIIIEDLSLKKTVNLHKRSTSNIVNLSLSQACSGNSCNASVTNESMINITNQPITEPESSKILPGNTEGILILSLKDIFYEIEKKSEKKFFLRCSYLEIYNDSIYDLFNPQDKLNEVLTINEDSNKEFFIKGATEEIVSSLDEILQKIKKGETNRHYASTMMNHASSRSHTIFRLYVQSLPQHLENDANNVFTESILNFVDLAGSEKFDVHDNVKSKKRESLNISTNTSSMMMQNMQLKDRVKESQHINKSLFFLTQVISLRSQGKQDAFIPYRNSPLTKILRSSLGGNSRTAIILCINPNLSQIEQTMSTLRFGLNAKKIENKVQANIIKNANDEALKNLILEYEKKIADMEKQTNIDKTASKNLLDMIKKLQEQKKLLAESLLMARRTELFQNSGLIDLKKNKKFKWEHVHYENIGILQVLTSDESGNEKKMEYDFEGKYALQSLKNMKEENNILQNKLKIMKDKIDEFEKEKQELLETINKKDKTLNKKRANMHTLKKKLSDNNIEISRFRQIIDFYQNKNIKGMKRLSFETLSKVEKCLINLLDNIKLQKCLKHIRKQMSNTMMNQYHNTTTLNNNNNNQSYGQTEGDKDAFNFKIYENMLSNIIFNQEFDKFYPNNFHAKDNDNNYIEFEEEFFEFNNDDIVNISTTKKCKLLENMQSDPNIFNIHNNIIMQPKLSQDIKCDEIPCQKEPHYVQSIVTSPLSNLNTFQNYFVSIAKQDLPPTVVINNDLTDNNKESENLDYKLAKLRGSYRHIIDLIKKDSLTESKAITTNLLNEEEKSLPNSIKKSLLQNIDILSPLGSPKINQNLFKDKSNFGVVNINSKYQLDENKYSNQAYNYTIQETYENNENFNSCLNNILNNVSDENKHPSVNNTNTDQFLKPGKTSIPKDSLTTKIDMDYSKYTLISTNTTSFSNPINQYTISTANNNSNKASEQQQQFQFRPKHTCLNL